MTRVYASVNLHLWDLDGAGTFQVAQGKLFYRVQFDSSHSLCIGKKDWAKFRERFTRAMDDVEKLLDWGEPDVG